MPTRTGAGSLRSSSTKACRSARGIQELVIEQQNTLRIYRANPMHLLGNVNTNVVMVVLLLRITGDPFMPTLPYIAMIRSA